MTRPPDSAQPALDLLRGLGGDDFVATLVRTFLGFARDRVADIDRGAQAGELGAVAAAAHSMKSSAAQLGAMALSEACAATERAAKAGDAPGAQAAASTVVSAFNEALPWLEALGGTG